MKNIVGLIIFLVIILIISYRDGIEAMFDRKPVCNNIDGRCYEVIETFDDKDRASEYLAKINIFVIDFLRYIRKKYIWEKQGTQYKQNLVRILLSNYSVDALIENNPKNGVNTSYVEDKGKIFAVCLREKTSGENQLHNFGLLQYVILHELAHLSMEEYGHNDTFWLNFKILIQEAESAGLYTPVDYSKNPINYCYLDISYSPYFDPSYREPKN